MLMTSTIKVSYLKMIKLIFIKIGEYPEDEEEKQKSIDKLHEQYPNRLVIIDNITKED